MDIATVLGLIGASAIILVAILLGGDFLLFVNIPSILIVVGGSILVVAMKFSMKQVPKAFGIGMKAFMFKMDPAETIIEECIKLADIAKKGGPLALEKVEIKNDYLRRGIMQVVDGLKPELIMQNLLRERNEMQARHEEGQRFFRALADVSPAMGMIGTLIGLVQMLANMSDPESIGPAMAVALLTTLYGAIIANVVATPLADKLELRSNEESTNCNIAIDTVNGINAQLSSTLMKDALANYLPSKERPQPEAAA